MPSRPEHLGYPDPLWSLLASTRNGRDHRPMDWGTLLGAIVGAIGAIGGGYLASWMDAKARREQWEREQREESRRLAAVAAADAESTWERTDPQTVGLGGHAAVRARVDDLLDHLQTAHASLTRALVDHPKSEVREAARVARDKLTVCTNDAAYYAHLVSGQRDDGPTREHLEDQRGQARAALDDLVAAILHEG